MCDSAMSTATLSSQLQDYLKHSNTDSSSTSSTLLQNPLSGKFGWFSAKNNSLHQQVGEEATTSGWFSEAQKDPLLPSLVSRIVTELLSQCDYLRTVFYYAYLYCNGGAFCHVDFKEMTAVVAQRRLADT